MAYLMHFNGLHSPKTGQFTSGDGDSDGIIDDHHHWKQNHSNQNYVTSANVKTFCSIGKVLAGKAFAKTNLGIVTNQLVKTTKLDKMMKQTNWYNYKAEQSSKFYDKAASGINRAINKYGG